MGILNTTEQNYYNSPSSHGNYQFVSLQDIINQFMIVYVGDEKVISKASRTDVSFHAQRALAEYSFDTFKSFKNTEFTIPNSLKMTMPQDYVSYTKISWIDGSGIKHRIYPTRFTSDPENPFQASDGEYKLTATALLNNTLSIAVLDSEYKNIKVGMIVTGPYIPLNTYVQSSTNAAGITTVGLSDITGLIPVLPTIPAPSITAAEIILNFEDPTGELVHDSDYTEIIELLSWNTTDFKVTASATSDFDNIEVGMMVSHKYWPSSTTVVNVNKVTGVLVLDQLPLLPQVLPLGEITFISPNATSRTWASYRSASSTSSNDDYKDDTYWPLSGERYGIEPEHANSNGNFYINEQSGKIHFSSNLLGKTIILDYISDGLGTDEEMKVHKFAEDAMYKTIAYDIMSYRRSAPEYIIQRFKKDKVAAGRKAKLRLSNIKLEELTQILRGKSKQIKH